MAKLKWKHWLSSQSLSSHSKQDEAERTKTKGDREASVEEKQSKSLVNRGGRRRAKEQFGGDGVGAMTSLRTPAGSPGEAACAPAGRLSLWPGNRCVAKQQPAARRPVFLLRGSVVNVRSCRSASVATSWNKVSCHVPINYELPHPQDSPPHQIKKWHHPVLLVPGGCRPESNF